MLHSSSWAWAWVVLAALGGGAWLAHHDHPAPQGIVHDETALLLAGRTLADGRLANPPHPQWEFFESFYVLHHPTRQAKYPPGQPMVLALGYWLGHPVRGVWLILALWGVALLVALQGLARSWLAAAVAVGFVLHFGVFSYYGHSYWGGGLFGLAGALVLAAVIRLARGREAPGQGWWHGLGLALLSLTRPFEGLVFALPGLLLEAREVRRVWLERGWGAVWRRALPVLLPVLVAVTGQLGYNRAVTGQALVFPYYLYNREYMAAAPDFLWSSPTPSPAARHEIFAQAESYWVMRQAQVRENHPSTAWLTWCGSLRDIFPGLLPLGLVLVAAVPRCRRDPLVGWLMLHGLLLGLVHAVSLPQMIGRNPHYTAAWTNLCPVLFLTVLPSWAEAWPTRWVVRYPWLRRLPGLTLAVMAAGVLAGTRPVRHWSVYLAYREQLAAALQARAEQAGGVRQVVFLEYGPTHRFTDDWVFNGPDIDAQAVVWARSRGDRENRRLLEYYRGAEFWLVAFDSGRYSVQVFTYPERRLVQSQIFASDGS